MTLATVPDVERIASDYLRSHADIQALNTRVVGKPPAGNDRDISWVMVTELNAPTVGYPSHLIESMMQFDCYAGEPGSVMGGQPGANLLARTVRAVLQTLPGARTGGVITGVQVQGGPRLVDTSMEPARDRKILTVLIWSHA